MVKCDKVKSNKKTTLPLSPALFFHHILYFAFTLTHLYRDVTLTFTLLYHTCKQVHHDRFGEVLCLPLCKPHFERLLYCRKFSTGESYRRKY